MRGRRIAAAPNLVIATVTMAGTAGAMASGRALSLLISPGVGSALGSLIIIAIGAATIVASLRTVRQPIPDPNPPAPPRACAPNQAISWREALVPGVALSLNNVGSGVGAGAAGVHRSRQPRWWMGFR